MKNEKTIYVCCVYFGERRNPIKKYNEDRLCLIKEQIKSLEEFEHSLDRIVFVFNLEQEHIEYFKDAVKIIPKKIQNTRVEIIPRENVGLSYAAWSDVFEIYNSEFDYYIFNEDDYFLNQNNFDTYMVNKFKSYQNIGFLAGLIGNPRPDCTDLTTHAANSFGISSYEVLKNVHDKFGKLPCTSKKYNDLHERYTEEGVTSQITQTGEIFKMGYNLFDFRDDYQIPHDMGKSRPNETDLPVTDRYFWWNENALILPATLRFNEETFIINVIDQDCKKKRTCYIINFYFGDRRRVVEEYNNDRLFYLKTQIQTLKNYYHNIDKIIFNFNVEKEHYGYLNDALKIIPKKIQNSDIDISIRENKGLSYGAFSDLAYKEKDNYDYFIFNEDDYFLVQNNWDQYMIRKFNVYPDTGYFCAFKRERDTWNGNRGYAGHCFGITSAVALNMVYEKYGQLPFNSETNNYKTQEEAQIMFSYSFEDVGLKLYDIREEYRLGFAMTEKLDQDIWRLFWWNKDDLIISPIMFLNKAHTWWEAFDEPFQKRNNLD